MTSNFSIQMNEYLPLRDVVFQTLRQAILRGELEPGERLMEIHLANRLGVSRTPIREAIRKLELEGLVVMIPRRGAIVASITEKDLKDVLEVRRTLEIMAGEIACERITPELLEQLLRSRKLPVNELSAGSGTDRKTMERHRKYLVAILLAFTNGYEIIRGHLCQLGEGKEEAAI